MARLTNSQYPHLREVWDEVYRESQLGNRYIADHVAGLTWDDLRAPATALNPPGAVSDPDRDTTTGHFLFDKAGTETLIIFLQFPHTWAEGTSLSPHVHWIKEATGVVVWQLEYKWYNPAGGDYPTSYTTATVQTVSNEYGLVSPAVNVATMSFFPRIVGTGKLISSIFECKVSRLGGNGSDNYDQDARFVEFDLHIQLVGHGSFSVGSRDAHMQDIAGV